MVGYTEVVAFYLGVDGQELLEGFLAVVIPTGS